MTFSTTVLSLGFSQIFSNFFFQNVATIYCLDILTIVLELLRFRSPRRCGLSFNLLQATVIVLSP